MYCVVSNNLLSDGLDAANFATPIGLVAPTNHVRFLPTDTRTINVTNVGESDTTRGRRRLMQTPQEETNSSITRYTLCIPSWSQPAVTKPISLAIPYP